MLSLLRTLFIAAMLAALSTAPKTWAQGWSAGPSMNVARSDAAFAVLDGDLYVIGGRNTTGQALDDVEKFDPEMGTWSVVASLRDARYAAAAAVSGGQILLAGGSDYEGATDDVEVYVPEENDWESFESLEEDRTGLAPAVLDGLVFMLGGASDGGGFLATCEGYDPVEDEWYIYPEWILDPGRASFGAATVDNVVYTAGGFSQLGPIDRVERYSLNGGSVDLAPLAAPRGRLALVSTDGAFGGDLFAIGGEDANGVLDVVERYDNEQNVWVQVEALETARAGAVAVYLDGAIYVVGGEDAFGNALRTVEVYAVMTDSEEPTAPTAFALDAAYPNPFADQTTLAFELGEGGPVTLAVYDVQGRRVATLVDRVMAAGVHRTTWDGRAADGRPLPSGAYLARLGSDAGTAVVKLTVLR